MQIILIVCMLLPVQASVEQKSVAGVEQTIVARQHEMDKAWLRHDVTTVGRMFADDYIGITHTGRVIGAEIMKAVAHNDETATEESEEQVKVLGAKAIYTAVITDYGTRQATHAPYTLRTRIMQVWALRNGNWQVVAEQETEVRN